MSEENKCETCGAVIPADAPGGACPGCLLGVGLGADDAPAEPFDREELARILPQFEIEAFVGQGGMGVVYRARQKSLDRVVALKILTRDVAKDPAFAERFTREARALAALNHPNIVSVYEAGRAEDLWYLTMEFVDGVNLRQAERVGRLAPAQALSIVPQICDALQYAHDEGVVHRDIKPENILLDRKGGVKIADFGLAKLLRPDPTDLTLTGTEQVMGTVHYIAPEQMRTPQDVDHRADIYSLGVVFYEMLTGDLPIGRFPNPSEKVEVDVRLDEVVLRTLERERDRRYQRVSDVKTSMEDIATSPPLAEHVKVEGDVRVGPGESRLSMLAVAGIMCWPIAVLVALLMISSGARDEIGMWAGFMVVVTGIILSWIARNAIRRDPQRLHGLGLANLGVMIPLVLLAVGLVLSFVAFFFLMRVEPPDDGPMRAEEMAEMAAERDTAEAARKAEDEVFRVRARWLIERLDALGRMRPVESLLKLIDPGKRESFRDLLQTNYKTLVEEKALGLAMLDRDDLPAPLTEFKVHRVVRQGDRAAVTLAHGESRIEYGMVRAQGMWFLDVGLVVTHFPTPSMETLDGIADQLDAILFALPERSGPEDLDALERYVDPRARPMLRSLDPRVFRVHQDKGGLGLAFRPGLLLPGLTKAQHTELRPEDFVGSKGRMTIWTDESDHAVRFPVVRYEGRWYLGVDTLEKLPKPKEAEEK